MTDLGTLPGDFLSFASGINDNGQVVGQSCDVNFNCRAFLWQSGVMTDLNGLIPPDSSLYLVSAKDVNSRGEIVGQAFDENTGDAPAFLAIPIQQETQMEGPAGQVRKRVILPEGLKQFINKRRGLTRF